MVGFFIYLFRKCLNNKQYAAQTRVCSLADELLSVEGQEAEEARTCEWGVNGEGGWVFKMGYVYLK